MALEVEASAGISIFPDDASNSSELLRCADVAVNHAKRTSKRIVRYSPDLDQHTPERLELASDLGRAIRDNQLVLHYQPVVNLADGRPIGFEALVRWRHPKLGLLPPDRFIPLAEVGELIHPLTYWVVENALEQLREWQRKEPSLTMAVNLSTRNLLDRSCAKRLAEIIDRAQVDPRTVEFELTETALLIDLEATSATLSRISDSGARVVIDDFGTGYSSMAFLKRYRIHALKIDRSFVGDMRSDVQSRAIVRATVQLARDLDLAAVAEGIEEAGTVDALSEIGCTVGQGFYFLRPCAADEVEHRMEDWGLG
jgi:EAL domain-containing protein (putative c-di-GMP-specific phosphodiesterase class I)